MCSSFNLLDCIFKILLKEPPEIFIPLLSDRRLRERFLATLEMTEMGVEMTGGVK